MENCKNQVIFQTVIIENAKDPLSTGYVDNFEGDGYIASAVMYTVCFLVDFFTPSIIAFLGLKVW